MSAQILAFSGGLDKTSLVYHLAWMYADLGLRIVAADLDPQAYLTAAFLGEERLETLWSEGAHDQTVYGCVEPLIRRTGDVAEAHLEPVTENLALLVGDPMLREFEDQLSSSWPGCMDGRPADFRTMSAFWHILQRAAESHGADLVLMDVGPNLGAINRAALVGADSIVVPLAPDLFSLQGLRNLGPTLRRWREQWDERVIRNPEPGELTLPSGKMEPLGYVVLQHAVRLDRPVEAYKKWMSRIPQEYSRAVLGQEQTTNILTRDDPNCIAEIKHYRSLMPLAQDARKPIFHLKAADGALGAHLTAAQAAHKDFETLAREIAARINLEVP